MYYSKFFVFLGFSAIVFLVQFQGTCCAIERKKRKVMLEMRDFALFAIEYRELAPN